MKTVERAFNNRKRSMILFICNLLLIFVIIFSGNITAQHNNIRYALDKILNSDGSIKPGANGSFNAEGYNLEYNSKGAPVFKKASLKKTLSTATWSGLGTGRTGLSNIQDEPARVYTVAVNSSGEIYVGGRIAIAGDIVVHGIAKWDGSAWSALPCGTTDGVSGYVYSIKIDGTDVYVGGDFASLSDGTTVNHIAKWDELTGTWSALSTGVISGIMLNEAVYDIAIIGSTVYAAGIFQYLGDGTTVANNIAKWDGANWSTLSDGGITGIGVSGSNSDAIYTLAVIGNKLYAAGEFTKLGDGTTTANNIAVWDEDTDTWSALSYGGINGVSGYVDDIAASGTTLYVGGNFTKLGDGTTTANYIARWDESTGWSALTDGSINGTGDIVDVILVDGTDIYIGGDFTTLGDGSTTANHLVKWNGSAWSAVTDGSIDGVSGDYICSLAMDGNNIYVGGFYQYLSDGITVANSIATWDKSSPSWTTFGSGDNGVDGIVRAVLVNGDYIYVGGYFTTINGGAVPATFIARWNYKTNTWSTLSAGIDVPSNMVGSYHVHALAATANYLYAAGAFVSINGGTAAYNIARYNLTNGTWSALSDGTNSGVNSTVYTLTANGNNIYVGGTFTSLSGSGATANYVACWNEDTGTWSALNDGVTNGVSSRVLSAAVNGNFVYFGGYFNDIKCWNTGTNTWSTLSASDGSYANYIRAMVVKDNVIYAGANYYGPSGGSMITTAAKFDIGTSTWSALGSNCLFPDAPVYAIALCGDDVYAGGAISLLTDFTSLECIAKYNIPSETWEPIAGTNNYIYALAINGCEGKMYAGGWFNTAGQNAAFDIASFTDSGNILPVEIISLSAQQQNNAIVLNWQTKTEVNNYGFEIERAASRQLSASSQGQSFGDWVKVGFVKGSGTSNSQKYYTYIDSPAGGSSFKYRLKQVDLDGTYKFSDVVEVSLEGITVYSLEQNFPNPFNPTTTIKYQIPQSGFVTLKIFDVLGREVKTLVSGNQVSGMYTVEFNASELPSGVYIYKLSSGNFSEVKKLLLLK